MEKNEYREITFKEMQKMELEVLVQIDSICRKHGITYFLMFGTLLGAVRHHGFIPWDYDIDIALLRKEFDRLINVLTNDEEFSNKYFIQTINSDKKYSHTLVRILIKDTKFCWKNGYTGIQKNGIHIDIFPFEVQSFNEKEMQKQYKKKTRLNLLYYYRFGNLNANTLIKKVEKKLLHLFLSPLTIRVFTKKRLKLSKNSDVELEKAVIGNYNDNMKFMKGELFKEFMDIDFEGHQFIIPKRYDEILKFLYGDYMQFPPENQRIIDVHGFVKVGDHHE